MELSELPSTVLRGMLVRRDISPRDLLEATLRRIDERETDLNAYVTLCIEEAMDRASRLEEDFREPLPPLYGIPIGIKDNLCTRGLDTTCASKILLGYKPSFHATTVERTLQAGAVLLGKTNMDEFAMGSTGEFSYFGPTRNPWDRTRVAGGSSSGSAAALASGTAALALGSDTGGSVRLPSAFSGVVGLKPTYGRLSRYGLLAFASSLDQVGPMARTVEDTALLFSVVAGPDARDSTSAQVPAPDFETLFDGYVGDRPRIGVPREYVGPGLSPEVESAVSSVVDRLSNQDFPIIEVSLPHTDDTVAVYQLVSTCEASSNLARYDGTRFGFRTRDPGDLDSLYVRTRGEGFGPEVKRRILLGTFALSEGYYEDYYLKAQRARRLLRDDFVRAFEEADVLLGPISPVLPVRIGERIEDPLSIYLLDVLTAGVNLAGLPALSLPCGRSRDGLPIGLQLIGKPFQEAALLRLGRHLEDVLGVS
jgi:aspartyl-tRNA(Asn)/glutamyl-tRNA(Gln) amidotransferase subunit A